MISLNSNAKCTSAQAPSKITANYSKSEGYRWSRLVDALDAARKAGAQPQLKVVDGDVVQHAVGAGKVDVLEDARRRLIALRALLADQLPLRKACLLFSAPRYRRRQITCENVISSSGFDQQQDVAAFAATQHSIVLYIHIMEGGSPTQNVQIGRRSTNLH